MKQHFLFILAMLCCMSTLKARPVDAEQAQAIGQKFLAAQFDNQKQANDLSLVYTGTSQRGEVCFYAFNAGTEGFVIVSADDRFRPIVGYSVEGPFETENMSPELAFYLEKIIEARTSRNAVLFDDTAEEWQSLRSTGHLISRNGGKSATYICSTKWNQDSPYNLYAPAASSGPGGRCYAGCVATAMSQVMKHWNHPLQGKDSHSYFCPGYGRLEANFGETTYDWEHMTDKLGAASTQEEIEAVALFMYHCAVAVNMNFSPNGSGANSTDVPKAIRRYFYYATQAQLRNRDSYSLTDWQDMLKDSFDKNWPLYYSGFSNSGGHAFVCDGYDDNDLFHFNWGWGGSSDGWFVIDEIDYATWAQAVFNYVPAESYAYMPMQPENFEVVSLGDDDYSAIIRWTNPIHNIHNEELTKIDQIVVTRNGEIIYTKNNVEPGADMSFTDHYMPTMVRYGVYAIVHNAKGLETHEDGVLLGPSCTWSIEMSPGWNGAYISLVNAAGVEIAQLTAVEGHASLPVNMPKGYVGLYWNKPTQAVETLSFNLKDADGTSIVAFEGASTDMNEGLFFVVNNTCTNEINYNAPTNLHVDRDGEKVRLRWEAPVGEVSRYGVYRDNLLIAITNTTKYFDTEYDNFNSYYVTAINEMGESAPSNTCDLQVNGLCTAPADLRFEMANNKVKLIWDAPESESPTGYYIYRRTKGEAFKRIKSIVNTTYSDNINSHGNEVYEYAVAAYYSNTDCTSAFANALDHPELHYIVVNKTAIPMQLTDSVVDMTVFLSWEPALMAETYNVYCNGELIAQDLTETALIIENLELGNVYRYTVTGQTAFMESSPSNSVLVDMATATPENTVNLVSVYPNPSSGRVHIEGKGIRQIIVFNLMGQEVMRQAADGDYADINLTNLPNGTYFIKAIAENGTNTVKILKTN